MAEWDGDAGGVKSGGEPAFPTAFGCDVRFWFGRTDGGGGGTHPLTQVILTRLWILHSAFRIPHRGTLPTGRVSACVAHVEFLFPAVTVDPAGAGDGVLGAVVEDAAGEVVVAEGAHLAFDAGDVAAGVFEIESEAVDVAL